MPIVVVPGAPRSPYGVVSGARPSHSQPTPFNPVARSGFCGKMLPVMLVSRGDGACTLQRHSLFGENYEAQGDAVRPFVSIALARACPGQINAAPGVGHRGGGVITSRRTVGRPRPAAGGPVDAGDFDHAGRREPARRREEAEPEGRATRRSRRGQQLGQLPGRSRRDARAARREGPRRDHPHLDHLPRPRAAGLGQKGLGQPSGDAAPHVLGWQRDGRRSRRRSAISSPTASASAAR